MNTAYREGLRRQIDEVYQQHPELQDHRRAFPWLAGALGDPDSGVWFVAENPSLGQLERATDPMGGAATPEAQWWASRGDQLLRTMLVKHGFKQGGVNTHGGWRCYLTNVIKEADYAERWRGTPAARQKAAARAWLPVLLWEMEQSRPRLVVTMGGPAERALRAANGENLPTFEHLRVPHYSYIASRPAGRLGPMHPERVAQYEQDFARVAQRFRELASPAAGD